MFYIDKKNLKRMIAKERLILSYEYFSDRFHSNFLLVLISISCSFLVFGPILNYHRGNSTDLGQTILLSALGILIPASVIFLQVATKKLVRIKGYDLDTNRKKIKDLSKKLNLTLVSHNQQLSTLKPTSAPIFSWNKTMYVLFDGNDILVGHITLGRNNALSPFHGLARRFMVSSVKKEFQSLQ